MIDARTRRKLKRERDNRDEHVLVAVDQSYGNFAAVKFVNGIPNDRVVFHSGDSTAQKNKLKQYGAYFETPTLQLNYLTEMFLDKLEDWNPNTIVFEGLSFGSTSASIFQLGALYYGMQVTIHREFGLPYDSILSVTPAQAKNTARTFLVNGDQYEREKAGEVIRLKSGKPKMKVMTKKDMKAALDNTPYAWITDGYTHDGLVASRTTETGIFDLPDSIWIGIYALERYFKHKYERPKDDDE